MNINSAKKTLKEFHAYPVWVQDYVRIFDLDGNAVPYLKPRIEDPEHRAFLNLKQEYESPVMLLC